MIIIKKNTPLVTHIYTADPSAHVFDGKLYIYPSHDLEKEFVDNDNGDQYAMEDYHIRVWIIQIPIAQTAERFFT
jgi:hypothetical protein